jgi:hypothetical protein
LRLRLPDFVEHLFLDFRAAFELDAADRDRQTPDEEAVPRHDLDLDAAVDLPVDAERAREAPFDWREDRQRDPDLGDLDLGFLFEERLRLRDSLISFRYLLTELFKKR